MVNSNLHSFKKTLSVSDRESQTSDFIYVLQSLILISHRLIKERTYYYSLQPVGQFQQDVFVKKKFGRKEVTASDIKRAYVLSLFAACGTILTRKIYF